jgi:DNA-binding NarL/FixJ family response regulator
MLTAGLSNTEIARRMALSPKTVEHHVAAVLAKLEVDTRRAAAAIAQQHG